MLEALYTAYTNEDIGSFMARVATDYQDNSGNNRDQLRQCLSQIFDTYEMRRNLAQRSLITQTTEENPKIEVLGNVASATVVTSDAYKIPELAFFDVNEQADINTTNVTFRFPRSGGDVDRIPFNQTATLIELGDGRGWFLEVYDIEEVGRVDVGQDFDGLDNLISGQSTTDFDFITRYNRVVQRWAFERQRTEGPRRISLVYDGPRGNNVYMLLFHRYLLDRQNRFTPPELLIRWYSGREVVFRNRGLFWEFRYSGTRWELVRGQMIMVLPLRDADVDPTQETVQDPIGFSFRQRGPAIEFFEGDVDFHYIDEALETVCTLGGIVDLTDQFGIDSIEEAVSRLEEMKKISRALLQPTSTPVVDHVYMVLSCDGGPSDSSGCWRFSTRTMSRPLTTTTRLLVDSALIFRLAVRGDVQVGAVEGEAT
ncbi:hypothetical protein HS125_02540 [bacterium]|nr:hypothetical protein [bacterium]